MAGGSGTRFWPESTRETPKQFLSLFGDETMIQSTVARIAPMIPPERIWVITNQRYADLVHEQLPDLPRHNIIGEAVAKNTAPCVAAAAALIQHQDDNATMAVLPADHLIADPEAFRSVLEAGARQARQNDALVTIGIKPTRPETGYGYIEFDKESGQTVDGHEAKKVVQFREKPNITTARQFIYASRFLWNSGMFIWTTDTILAQFQAHQTEIHEAIGELKSGLGGDDETEAINEFYHACPSISIDYGIMENAADVFVIPGEFGWNDVGSWKALYELSDKDEKENVLKSEHSVTEKAAGNIIHSGSDKIIALVGVENLAVVETENAILVCNLDEAQGVKQIVNQLKEKDGKEKFL
jgi:mannose-1-phosphate guanylyltransferase